MIKEKGGLVEATSILWTLDLVKAWRKIWHRDRFDVKEWKILSWDRSMGMGIWAMPFYTFSVRSSAHYAHCSCEPWRPSLARCQISFNVTSTHSKAYTVRRLGTIASFSFYYGKVDVVSVERKKLKVTDNHRTINVSLDLVIFSTERIRRQLPLSYIIYNTKN